MGREAFVERVWEWKEQSGGTIIGQLKRLGASCDWERKRFTMGTNGAAEGEPLPWPVRMSIADLLAANPRATMADVVVGLGVFPSLSQARKAGWCQPLAVGVHSTGKRRAPVELIA